MALYNSMFSSPPPRGGAGLGNIQGRSPSKNILEPKQRSDRALQVTLDGVAGVLLLPAAPRAGA